MNAHRDDPGRREEADAILKRLREETEPQVGAHSRSMLSDPVRHFSAGDADPNDRIEVIGTRIGRLAGLVGFVVLAGMLVVNHLLP